MLSSERKRALATKAKDLPAILQVGKNGLSDAFVAELRLLLEKKGLVKVRFLRSFVESSKAAEAAGVLAASAKAEIVGVVGNTAVFYRATIKKNKQ